MLQLVVLLNKNTLAALREHTSSPVTSCIDVNEREALVLLDADVVAGLLERARPGDKRLDDVVLRLAV
jgi:hypothetical protein